MIRFTVTILMTCLTLMVTGLNIDINTKDVDVCNHSDRVMKIMCMTSANELGNNKLTIYKGPSMMKVTECHRRNMNCTTPMVKRYSAMFEGDNVTLKVMVVDYMNDSTTWSCIIGNMKATMKVRLPERDPCELWHACFGLTNNQFIIFIVVVAAVIICLISIIVCCAVCRGRKGGLGSCAFCRCNCRHTDEEKKTGYQGKHWEVQESFKIDDPNHVPDASAKQMESRTVEAKKACENFGEEGRQIAKEKLEKYVEDRSPPPDKTTTPLLSDGEKK